MTLSFQYAYGHSCQKLRTRTQMRARPCGSYIRKKKTARPKTMSRAEAMSPNPCGDTPGRGVAGRLQDPGGRGVKEGATGGTRERAHPPARMHGREGHGRE